MGICLYIPLTVQKFTIVTYTQNALYCLLYLVALSKH